jgi:two-component system, NarL family, response regulator DegU
MTTVLGSPKAAAKTSSLTVMLVDDHTMLRQGLRRSLETEGITVVAEASNGEEALKIALETKPTVVLMDVSMPQIDGIEATRRLMAADNRQRVVILTMHIDRDVIERAMKAGAVGYMTKDSTVKEVVMAVKLAANGDRILSPRLAELMLAEATTADEPDSILTNREEELLQLIADGLATSEVASRMYISPKTVKNHLASIYEKLQARDRTQAVLTAVKMGIVKLT